MPISPGPVGSQHQASLSPCLYPPPRILSLFNCAGYTIPTKTRPLNGLVDTGEFYLGGENSPRTPAYHASGQVPQGLNQRSPHTSSWAVHGCCTAILPTFHTIYPTYVLALPFPYTYLLGALGFMLGVTASLISSPIHEYAGISCD